MSIEPATWLKDNRIDEVELLVPDIAGVACGKFMPASKFLALDHRLPESIFIQAITGDYVDDVFELDRDMVLEPDMETLRLVPWAPEPTCCLIADCYRHDGTPIDIAPRQVLKNVLALYAERGWRPVVAPEVEFYLVKKNIDPDYPLEPPIGRSGRPEAAGKPYSIDAVNEFDAIIEDIYDYCEAMNIDADSLSHEAGAGQLEINFNHGDPLSLADQVFLFKRVVREAAMKHGIYATFMAKPMAKEPGSALHLHQSVIDVATGKNIFSDAAGEDTPAFEAFIGGLQRYLPEALPMFGPYVNSYRRFTRFLMAPINVHWGRDNRTVGLRVPVSNAQNRRIENRVAGSDTNPYLAIASSLACGYLGLTENLKRGEQVTGSAYDLPPSFTRDPDRALDLFVNSKALCRILGEDFVNVYAGIKRIEAETFFQVISPWEREYLLLNV